LLIMSVNGPIESGTGGGVDPGVLSEEVRRALAEDPTVGALDIDVTLRGNRAFVTGYAVTDERRDRITAVMHERLPRYEVHNETTTGALPDPGPTSEKIR
jgi:hypothetical protein